MAKECPLFCLVLCSILQCCFRISFWAQTNSVCAKILHTLTPTIYVKDENRRTSFAYQSYFGFSDEVHVNITVSLLKFNLQICVNSCEFSSFDMWILNNSFTTKAVPFIHPSMVNMDIHISNLQISMDSGDTLFHHSSKYGNAIHFPIWLQIVHAYLRLRDPSWFSKVWHENFSLILKIRNKI